jgi:hypothetical protein
MAPKTFNSMVAYLFRRSETPSQSGRTVTFFFSLWLTLFLFGLKMNPHCGVVILAFIGSCIFGTISIYTSLVVLAKIPRFIWTGVGFIILALFLFYTYQWLCPTFLIEPHELSFDSNDLYTVRLTNRSDSDKYAIAFLINIDTYIYTAPNFDLSIERQYLKQLPQQSTDLSQKFSDTFGLSGLLDGAKGDAFCSASAGNGESVHPLR